MKKAYILKYLAFEQYKETGLNEAEAGRKGIKNFGWEGGLSFNI